MKRSPHFLTSTATCSRKNLASRISTAICATRCLAARASIGRAFRPPFSARSFKPSWSRSERRQIGGHYTSERDILKVVRSLFLDDLRAEFEARKKDKSTGRRARLEEFHDKLCKLRFLDPACGCGNFLVITYRELRQLELETLEELLTVETKGQRRLQRELTLDEVNRLSQVDVDQFYGIEIGEWPARIAEVALWLMDHQMNLRVSEAFGQLYQRLPLKKSPHIHCANALRAGLENNSAARAMQLRPRQSAVRWKTIS